MKILAVVNVSMLMLMQFRVGDTDKLIEIKSATVIAPAATFSNVNESTVILSWSAQNSAGGSVYVIERSFYSDQFEPIATLKMPFSTENVSNYCIKDQGSQLSGRKFAHYRVKQVDGMGNIAYSEVKMVNLDKSEACTTRGSVNFSFSTGISAAALVKIKDGAGKEAKTIHTLVYSGNNTIDLGIPDDFAKGIYVAEVWVNNEIMHTCKLVAD